MSATSALGLAGTSRRGGAGGIGAWVSPGPWRMKPPGPTERYWMVSPFAFWAGGRWRCGCGCGAAVSASARGAASGAGAAFGAALAGLAVSFSSPGLTGDGRASRPEPVRLADHRVAADPAELVGDLAGGGALGPHLFRRSIRSSVHDIHHSPKTWPHRRRRLLPVRPADRRREVNDQHINAAASAMDAAAAGRAGAQRRQLGRAQRPLYQGGAPLLQGADADGVGAGDHHLAVPGDFQRRAGPRRPKRDGRRFRRFPGARPDHHGDDPERLRQLQLLAAGRQDPGHDRRLSDAAAVDRRADGGAGRGGSHPRVLRRLRGVAGDAGCGRAFRCPSRILCGRCGSG